MAWAAAGFIALALSVACGGPKYPKCDSDEQCNVDGKKGVCVRQTCVECRADEGCSAGKACRAGTCVAREGYCDEATPCPGGAPCSNHACDPAVASKEPVECDDEHPCRGPGEKCQNGHCVGPPPGGPGCRDFAAPRFDFDSPELGGEARQTLSRLADCLVRGSLKGRRVLLTGHCDPRGEHEYNMGLGAQRAEVARTFLSGLGVPADRITTSSRGKLDAAGADEGGWSKDRRVDIEVR